MLTKPLTLRGFELPPGVAVLAAASLLHEREDLYPEPHRFRPERFLERKPGLYEFIPFGGGAHRCLGAGLAMLETKVVLATILRLCDLRLASDRPIRGERRGLTMGPKGGVPTMLVGHREGHRGG
jgi:cytochrome P450